MTVWRHETSNPSCCYVNLITSSSYLLAASSVDADIASNAAASRGQQSASHGRKWLGWRAGGRVDTEAPAWPGMLLPGMLLLLLPILLVFAPRRAHIVCPALRPSDPHGCVHYVHCGEAWAVRPGP